MVNRTRYRDYLGQIDGVSQTFALGATYGYFAGGYSGNYSNITDRIVFGTGITSANTVSNLSTNNRFLAGVSDKSTFGYFCGGYTTTNNRAIDRITFSTGATAIYTTSVLSEARSGGWGCSDGVLYGYVGGGFNITTTDRITFSSSVVAANTVSNLNVSYQYCAAVSNGTYGYIPYNPGNTGGNRITFSTGAVDGSYNYRLSLDRDRLSGFSDGNTYGYFSGGTTGGGTRESLTDRITFSTGAMSASTVSNLSSTKDFLASNSDGNTYGYSSGGSTGAVSNTTDRTTFSTGTTAANTVSNISQARSGLAGLSDLAI